MTTLPYLTNDLPGIGGRIKQHVEDFQVDEIPLYEACGQGTHAYFRIRKRGIPTPTAVTRLARYMGVSPSHIGVAGMKDAQALTTQMLSLEHCDERKLLHYHDPQMQVLDVSRHGNKLRPGHLAGNRFTIRVRGVGTAQLPAAQAVLDVLRQRGVPNFFGAQRFGARTDTAALGEALVKGDLKEFVARYLGRAQPTDPPDCKAARDAFDAGFLDRAVKRWPRHYTSERHALLAYKRSDGRPGPVIAAVDKRMKRLYVSAFQSELFNEVLARRMATLDRVLKGDLAQKFDTGGIFTVDDEAVEQPRADRFEISPTGPIIGYRCHLADGEPGVIERQIVESHHVDLEAFRRFDSKGTRRALRFAIRDLAVRADSDPLSEFIELSFVLPSGCYATVLLHEVMKCDAPDAPADEVDAPADETVAPTEEE